MYESNPPPPAHHRHGSRSESGSLTETLDLFLLTPEPFYSKHIFLKLHVFLSEIPQKTNVRLKSVPRYCREFHLAHDKVVLFWYRRFFHLNKLRPPFFDSIAYSVYVSKYYINVHLKHFKNVRQHNQVKNK